MFFSNINILTVIVATIVGMGVGFLWYSPFLFAKTWLKAKGLDGAAPSGGKSKSMLYGHLVSLVVTFVTAVVLGSLFNSLIVTSVSGIFLTGLLLWLGFVVPVKLADVVYGGEKPKLFFIVTGHRLVEILAMSLIIGIFS